MINKNILFAKLMFSMVACLILISSCKDELNLPDQPIDSYNKVYMSAASRGTQEIKLKISDTLQTITYGASYGGAGYAPGDISVNFTVNPQLVADYNLKNRTSYPILPGDAYTLSNSSAVIPKGSVGTLPLSVSIKTKGQGSIIAFRSYLLPITMTTPDAPVNQLLTTSYFLISSEPVLANYPLFNRTDWRVIGMSSEEVSGEGSNNGRAIHALDNVSATFWHSKWQNGQASPPHFLTIDMGTPRELHGIYLLDRQNTGGGKPQDMMVQTSVDNVTWTDAGSLTGQNTQEPQYLWLKNGFPTARYFKIIINSSYDSGVAHIAELNAF